MVPAFQKIEQRGIEHRLIDSEPKENLVCKRSNFEGKTKHKQEGYGRLTKKNCHRKSGETMHRRHPRACKIDLIKFVQASFAIQKWWKIVRRLKVKLQYRPPRPRRYQEPERKGAQESPFFARPQRRYGFY